VKYRFFNYLSSQIQQLKTPLKNQKVYFNLNNRKTSLRVIVGQISFKKTQVSKIIIIGINRGAKTQNQFQVIPFSNFNTISTIVKKNKCLGFIVLFRYN